MESKPGRGSAFKIFLPACYEEAESCVANSRMFARQAQVHETILLVVDQAAIREVASDYLMQLGYDVLTAPDGEAAIKLAPTSKKPIHLLITDMVMPKMGGRELAARLSEMFSDAKVLYISGYLRLVESDLAAQMQDGEILRKPFSFKTLARRARLLLDSSKVTTADIPLDMMCCSRPAFPTDRSTSCK